LLALPEEVIDAFGYALYVAQTGKKHEKAKALHGSSQGAQAKVMLPTDGIYVVRVYLMRNAARRNESSNYTLTVGVTGKALAPLAASKDALIPGTKFHASAPTSATTCRTRSSGVVRIRSGLSVASVRVLLRSVSPLPFTVMRP
jgi:hypothetical protein